MIEVLDFGIGDQGQRYYTMELLGGHDLQQLAPLPWRKACAHLRDVATCLALLHARRLLHRDGFRRRSALDIGRSRASRVRMSGDATTLSIAYGRKQRQYGQQRLSLDLAIELEPQSSGDSPTTRSMRATLTETVWPSS